MSFPFSRLLVAVLFFWCAAPSGALAASPLEQLKQTMDRVLAVLKDPAAETTEAERREMLRGILSPHFDFFEMARLSMGRHWDLLDGRREEFILAFTAFIENSYMLGIERLRHTKIVYTGQYVENGYARVDATILPIFGDDVFVRYTFHQVNGEWKIYDMTVDNVSLIKNYRSQINRVLSIAGFDELLKRLQRR